MKVQVSADYVSYKKKTSEKEIVTVKKRTAGCWQKIGLEELADLNGNKGHAIIPSNLIGGIKAENWTAMQIFVLDFDHGSACVKISCKSLRFSSFIVIYWYIG